MRIIWLQTSKTQNNLRVIYLILLFPALLFLAIWLFFGITTCNKATVCVSNDNCYCSDYMDWEGILNNKEKNPNFSYSESKNSSLELALMTLAWALPVMLIWLLIWVYFQKQIIFSFTWSRELSRKDNPRIYNIVENLAISRWLPVPKVWIIEDSSMNAFATWWDPKNSYIVFSRGLIDNLSDREIEAVAGHELTHIINRDVKVMVIINVFIWMIGTIWYIMLRTASTSNSSNNKWWNPIALLWLILYFLSLLILPFINLAISRKKEYLADAGSVELTKDRDSMISALKKISTDARIEVIDNRDSNIASMFISNPRRKRFTFSELLSTHPPIEKRIEMLEMY